jgi:hypothetical protein
MKRAVFFLTILFIGCFFAQTASSAMLTVNIDGLDKLDVDPNTSMTDVIWSYQINFLVDGDWSSYSTDSVEFNTSSNHNWEAAPGIFVPYWQLDSGINGNELVILGNSNNESLSPLLNGELFTVTYPDEVTLSLASESFLLASDFVSAVDLTSIPDQAVFGPGNNSLTLTTQAVPLPSALLLLGSGLVGLVGIRRKKMN